MATDPERPWRAEHAIEAPLAARLIAAQHPELAGLPVRLWAEGWDNRAFLVGERAVFRFPRRAIAVPLLETETRALPHLAARLPWPVPAPRWSGSPGGGFPWPFAGYPVLPGTTADRAALSRPQRRTWAAPLGRFLAILHATPAEEARGWGLRPDPLGRWARPRRIDELRTRLERALAAGLLAAAPAWEPPPPDWRPREDVVVHGDLYVRHLLADAEGAPAGVIDWGDVHLGDPATDLAVVHGFLPPEAHDAFRAAYGSSDPDAWRAARFRAVYYALTLLLYGADTEDAALLREATTSLELLADGS